MKRVLIESPFAAATQNDRRNYNDYLRDCIYDSLSRGEAPFASHGFYTKYLKDTEPQERAQGMACGRAWAESANIIAFYVDHGMSPGMLDTLKWLLQYTGAPRVPKIEIRRLADKSIEEKDC